MSVKHYKLENKYNVTVEQDYVQRNNHCPVMNILQRFLLKSKTYNVSPEPSKVVILRITHVVTAL